MNQNILLSGKLHAGLHGGLTLAFYGIVWLLIMMQDQLNSAGTCGPGIEALLLFFGLLTASGVLLIINFWLEAGGEKQHWISALLHAAVLSGYFLVMI